MILPDAAIAIAGAGSIGCYAGGCLALGGRRVAFLARPRIADAIMADGLRLTDLEGRDRLLAPDAVSVTTDPAQALAKADVILVTVKSGATAEMAELIATHVRRDAIVVSLQNGVDNAHILRARLAPMRVLAGMVPFNVVQSGEDTRPLRFRRASEGTVLVEAGVDGLMELLNVEGFPVAAGSDMEAVLWGKLLFNLNNALVALSNLPLATQLADRRWRKVLAAQMDEALSAMRAAKVDPGKINGLKPSLLPKILRLPDWLFRLLARRMLAIDPEARSSMWEDLERRRLTEIGQLQGAVLKLAETARLEMPLTRRIVALVHDAEVKKAGSPGLSPEMVMPGRT